MALPLPIELCHYVYDFIHPFREFKRFQDLLAERDALLKKIEDSPDDILCITAEHLQGEDFDRNNLHLKQMFWELGNAAKQITEKQQDLLLLETINRKVKNFYEENPKMTRPVEELQLSEHQYRTYWCPISEIETKRMDNNIAIRRGLWTEDDRIEYDDLRLILNQGTIRDLVFHCETNGVQVHPRLKQQPQNQNETIQFRKELAAIAMSF